MCEMGGKWDRHERGAQRLRENMLFGMREQIREARCHCFGPQKVWEDA